MSNGLKSIIVFVICLISIIYCYSSEEKLPIYSHPATDVYPDWNLGIQLWTFHKYTFYEAIDKVASLGVSWVEAFPGQVLSQSQSDIRFDHNMESKYRKQVLNDLAARGLKLVTYGVVGLPNNEDQCRRVFDFAKAMGIKTIVSEFKKLNIEITIENELPTIECEELHLMQVFQNLLSNAIKYIDKQNGQIRIGCVEEDGFWKFSIADNGPGIEEKHFERIFKMFQALSTRKDFEGTGVGLTVAKKIVELYGGKIWVESKIGEGSTFFFALPKEEMGVNNEKLEANIAC